MSVVTGCDSSYVEMIIRVTETGMNENWVDQPERGGGEATLVRTSPVGLEVE